MTKAFISEYICRRMGYASDSTGYKIKYKQCMTFTLDELKALYKHIQTIHTSVSHDIALSECKSSAAARAKLVLYSNTNKLA